jgi:hypothetical protein
LNLLNLLHFEPKKICRTILTASSCLETSVAIWLCSPRKQMLGKTASRFVRRYCWSGGQNYQEFLCLITNVWQTLIFFLTWSSGRLCDSVQGFAEGRLASDMQSTSYVLQHKILNGNYASCIKLRNFAPFWKSWFLISERFLQWSHNVP